MSKIDIRGIIVGSEYDTDWMKEYIDRGIVTPESRFRTQLAEAATDEPLTVYINSPGGSVFAGNEMVNAALAWKQANKQKVHVEIGAMAASMGASFTIQAADQVKVHNNSLMMFHGAWGCMCGGEEAMQDYADTLGKINAAVKTTLLTRYELQPEQVDMWFAEGREGWLDAQEMKAAGIAQDIIGDPADLMELNDDEVKAFEAKGLKIAALAQGLAELKTRQEDSTDDGTNPDDPPADGGDSDEDPNADGDPCDNSEPTAEQLAWREEGRAAVLAEFTEQVNQLKTQIANLQKEIATLQSQRDKAQNQVAELTAAHKEEIETLSNQLRAANERTEQLLDGSLTLQTEPTTWEEAVEACGGGEKGHLAASKQYPELRAQFNINQRAKRKD